jgi:DNA modification methylase
MRRRGTIQLLLGDARKLDLPDNSVDLIVAHPPYLGVDVARYGGVASGQINFDNNPKKMLRLLLQSVKEMQRVLKPTGNLFIANGPQAQLDIRLIVEIMDKTKFLYLDRVFHNSYEYEGELDYESAEAIVYGAVSTWHHFSLQKEIYNNPFLVKRYNHPIWNLPFSNLNDPVDLELSKKYHVLDVVNKEIPKRFIEMFTKPGDVVLDPFGGSAIVAVTAAELGRHGISNDVSEDQLTVAKERMRLTFGE